MLILDVGVDYLLQWDTARAVARGEANVVAAPLGQSTREGLDEMREDFVTATSQREVADADGAAQDAQEVEPSTRAEHGTADDEKPIDTTDGAEQGQLTHMVSAHGILSQCFRFCVCVCVRHISLFSVSLFLTHHHRCRVFSARASFIFVCVVAELGHVCGDRDP